MPEPKRNPKEENPDDWRDRWESCPRSLRKESDAAYYHGLWEQVRRDRQGRGRYYGTSPVEAAVINAMDEDPYCYDDPPQRRPFFGPAN